MKKYLFTLVFTLACVALFGAKPSVLILTGQNNHNWRVSSVVLQGILNNSQKFKSVDLVISPDKGGDMSKFNPQFNQYDVVVLDYNGDRWSSSTDQAFLEYVQGGGGVVIYHAADNAFADWDEYNKIIALGGWEGRNEKSGPYRYFKDGELIYDNTPGTGGSHGKAHQYKLNIHNTKHPVVSGVPDGALHAVDELYDRMRGPGNIKEVLVSAFSEKSTGGSGREEPLVFTVDYHNAPIVHIMLGHTGASPDESPALNCPYFQKILINSALYVGK